MGFWCRLNRSFNTEKYYGHTDAQANVVYGDWQKAGIVLRSAVMEGTEELYPAVKILYGDILSAVLNFVVIALVVFLFARYILREEKIEKK